LNFRAAASKAVPSENFTPSRSFTVQVAPPSVVVTAVAMRGVIVPCASTRMSVSKIGSSWLPKAVAATVVWIGSRSGPS
jgi:hypothetical protein